MSDTNKSTFAQKLIALVIGIVSVGVITAGVIYLGLPLFGDLSNLDPAKIAALAGVAIAFGLEKLPVLATWFNGLLPDAKGWATAGANIGLGIGLFLMSCAGRLGSDAAIACTTSGALGLIALVLSSLVTSQAVYLTLIKPKKA